MGIDFQSNDVIHNVAVKFTPAFLPEAKKPYYLKTVHQPELDIHGIASKAEVYNVAVPAKVIEDGLTAGLRLISYLAADGYKIKTPLFTLKLKIPGEYDGSETHLPEGVSAAPRIQTSQDLRRYIREKVNVEFDGLESAEGLIAEIVDEATGLVDEVMTKGNILTINGYGLKIDADAANKDMAGVYFLPDGGGAPVKAEAIAVNEPRKLKLAVPAALVDGKTYRLVIDTWSSARGKGHTVKKMREMTFESTLTAQA